MAELAKLGITPAPSVTTADWESFHTAEEYEKAPYQNVLAALGCQVQRPPYSPMCDKLWMCDYERIDDPDSYAKIIERLQVMSGHRLALSNIKGAVDHDIVMAWVEFDHGGTRIHWDAEFDHDWMDPLILVQFDELLQKETDLALYSNHTEYGQSALFTCMTEVEFARFSKLSRVKFKATKDQV